MSNPSKVPQTVLPEQASAVEARPAPLCPDCGEPMPYYGGSGGFICHDFKVLTRPGSWFDARGFHVDDRRLNFATVRDIRRRS